MGETASSTSLNADAAAFKRDLRFGSLDLLMVAKKNHEDRTFQRFEIGSGCAYLSKTDKLDDVFQYRTMYFICTNYGDYRTSVKSDADRKRMNMTTKKIGCTAKFTVSLKTTGPDAPYFIIETDIPTTADHNHLVKEELYNFHPGVRKLSAAEEKQAAEMRLLGTTAGVMAQAFNAQRRVLGTHGVVTGKDVGNAAIRESVKTRGGLLEKQIVIKALEEIETVHPRTAFKDFTDDDGKLRILYFQIPEMGANLEKYLQVRWFLLRATNDKMRKSLLVKKPEETTAALWSALLWLNTSPV